MISYFMMIVVIVRVIIAVWNGNKNAITIRRRLFKTCTRNAAGLIANNFIDSKQLFIRLNKELPNVMLVSDIDVNKAVKLLDEKLDNIRTFYKHRQFDFEEVQIVFNMIIIVTNDGSIIEVSSIYNYVELLYTADKALWADHLVKELSAFRLDITNRALTRNVCVTGFAGQVN